MSKKIRIVRDDIPGTIEALLESDFWLYDLQTGEHYTKATSLPTLRSPSRASGVNRYLNDTRQFY